MAEPGELARLQRRFYDLVTAPVPVAEQGVREDDLAADFRADALASATTRLDVYAHMYFVRLRDVLAEQFPRLAAALGAPRFHNLVGGYLALAPPSHPSLRQAGARLAGYIAEHLADPRREWLAEVALLEWTHLDLFDGPDTAVVTFDEVRAMSPERLAALPVRLIPTQRLLRVHHHIDLVEQWDEDSEPLRGEAAILVWRRDLQIQDRVLDELEAQALAHCAEAAPPFAALCERLAEQRDEQAATVAAFQFLARWLVDGLIAR